MAKRKIKIIELKSVGSTNTYAKSLAEKGEAEGLIIIADEQTEGRGRSGKSFFSPAETGLYMSILVRPNISVEESLAITSITAIAAARAIESVANIQCGIKWVNDIYIDYKKVAGILTEGSFDYKADKVNYVIVGIGINLEKPENDFPDELKNVATSLGNKKIKTALYKKIAEEFFGLLNSLPSKEYIKEYKSRSIILNKRIEVLANERYFATAVDIDDECRLKIITENGEERLLSSGEVSLKIQKGE